MNFQYNHTIQAVNTIAGENSDEIAIMQKEINQLNTISTELQNMILVFKI